MNEKYELSSETTFVVATTDDLPEYEKIVDGRKCIALVAHDNKKQDLLEWALYNRALLVEHHLYATGTTGQLLSQTLETPVICLKSGPLGGDQQIGALIAEGELDLLIFFWDPLEPQPHDPDVKALIRIAVVWNLPVACDRATADYVISSPLMSGPYERQLPDYAGYIQRYKAEVPKIPIIMLNNAPVELVESN